MNTTPTLAQRALAAHNDRLRAIEIGEQHLVAMARQIAADTTKKRLRTEIDPAQIRVELNSEDGMTYTEFEIEGLSFHCKFDLDEPDTREYFQIVIDRVHYDVESLADVGKWLAKTNTFPQAQHPAPTGEPGWSDDFLPPGARFV